jgi:NADPH2:quinone reductase
MRRVVCSEFGDPERLELTDEPTPEPRNGEVLVEVAAVGVSFVDGLIVRGAYQVRPPLPFTPRAVLAGRVVAVGEAVDAVAPGDDVAAVMTRFGAYASHVVLPAEQAVPLPQGVGAVTAAAAMESYLTMVFAVTRRVTVEPGEHVVVLGAGGGIGLAAVDVARSLGARVLAVASSEEKRAAATAAGAEEAVGYDDLKNVVRAATGGGADVVIDPVGGPAAEASLRGLRAGGRYCVVGFASGEIPRLPANQVLLGNRTVVGVDWGDWIRQPENAAAHVALLSDVLGRIARHELHPVPPTSAPLAEAGPVLRRFAERRVTGKVVLVP